MRKKEEHFSLYERKSAPKQNNKLDIIFGGLVILLTPDWIRDDLKWSFKSFLSLSIIIAVKRDDCKNMEAVVWVKNKETFLDSEFWLSDLWLDKISFFYPLESIGHGGYENVVPVAYQAFRKFHYEETSQKAPRDNK